MTDDERPVIAAYDGSPAAEAALRAAAALFRGRTILVVCVWEPGLAMAMMSTPDTTGVGYIPPSREDVELVDTVQHDHATAIAEAGAALVRELGGRAEALPVPDAGQPGEAVAAIAEQRGAAAIAVGSRGRSAARSVLAGSTSRHLLHHAAQPVLVVRAPG